MKGHNDTKLENEENIMYLFLSRWPSYPDRQVIKDRINDSTVKVFKLFVDLLVNKFIFVVVFTN